MRLFFAFVMSCFFWAGNITPVWATANTANVLSLNTATTNITTGAYVTLGTVPATLQPAKIVIVNQTTSLIKIAIGAAGSEVDFVSVLPSFMETLLPERALTGNARISAEAVDATASSKYISVSLIP